MPNKKPKSKKRGPKLRKISIIEKKLGRFKAYGLSIQGGNTVFVDPRLAPKAFLSVLCHELLHQSYDQLTEAQIELGEQILGEGLWAMGYRRVAL